VTQVNYIGGHGHLYHSQRRTRQLLYYHRRTRAPIPFSDADTDTSLDSRGGHRHLHHYHRPTRAPPYSGVHGHKRRRFHI